MVDFVLTEPAGWQYATRDGRVPELGPYAAEEANSWTKMKQLTLKVAGWNKNRVLTDAEGVRSFERLQTDMPQTRRHMGMQMDDFVGLREIQFSQQGLGDKAVRTLVEACVKNHIRVGRLELWRNQLGDASAQALAQLIERSPEPGVYGLHLSHNYMSQVGVGMMLVSAVKTGFYPVQLPDSGGPVPLWLRVHDQQCPWPVLSSTGTEQRSSSFDKAKGLLSHLSKTLVQKFLLPKGKQLPDGFELFCMPKPTSNAWSSNTEVEPMDLETDTAGTSMSSRCSSRKCQSCSSAHEDGVGAAVHLPFFWRQGRRQHNRVVETTPPDAATLHKRDPRWRDWRPAARRVFAQQARQQQEGAAEAGGNDAPATPEIPGIPGPMTPQEIAGATGPQARGTALPASGARAPPGAEDLQAAAAPRPPALRGGAPGLRAAAPPAEEPQALPRAPAPAGAPLPADAPRAPAASRPPAGAPAAAAQRAAKEEQPRTPRQRPPPLTAAQAALAAGAGSGAPAAPPPAAPLSAASARARQPPPGPRAAVAKRKAAGAGPRGGPAPGRPAEASPRPRSPGAEAARPPARAGALPAAPPSATTAKRKAGASAEPVAAAAAADEDGQSFKRLRLDGGDDVVDLD